MVVNSGYSFKMRISRIFCAQPLSSCVELVLDGQTAHYLGKVLRVGAGWQGLSLRIATLGYAVPGSVLAVGIVLLFTGIDRQLAARLGTHVSVRQRGLAL